MTKKDNKRGLVRRVRRALNSVNCFPAKHGVRRDTREGLNRNSWPVTSYADECNADGYYDLLEGDICLLDFYDIACDCRFCFDRYGIQANLEGAIGWTFEGKGDNDNRAYLGDVITA